jgi:hypothetical protein
VHSSVAGMPPASVAARCVVGLWVCRGAVLQLLVAGQVCVSPANSCLPVALHCICMLTSPLSGPHLHTCLHAFSPCLIPAHPPTPLAARSACSAGMGAGGAGGQRHRACRPEQVAPTAGQSTCHRQPASRPVSQPAAQAALPPMPTRQQEQSSCWPQFSSPLVTRRPVTQPPPPTQLVPTTARAPAAPSCCPAHQPHPLYATVPSPNNTFPCFLSRAMH